MLILLSPAKSMNMTATERRLPATEPLFLDEARYIVSKMREYPVDQLKKMLRIDDGLAKLNWERYQKFGTADSPSKQAILAYNGSVFRHIDPGTLSDEDLLYAQDRLMVISTLYGLLRPLDRIEAYRLQYTLKLDGITGNLYDYWLPKLTGPLIEAVQKAGGIVIDLASNDVQGSLQMGRLAEASRVVKIDFQEHRDGKYETVRTYAKMARGEMARHILHTRIESPDELLDFHWDRFTFNPDVSDKDRLVFTREKQ